MISSLFEIDATMALPGETEAGSAEMQPCRGIAWWAHRDDDRSAEILLPCSSQNHIASVDPNALKIPARRAESALTEYALVPFHAEPGHPVLHGDLPERWRRMACLTVLNNSEISTHDFRHSTQEFGRCCLLSTVDSEGSPDSV